ncbi:hypothetical protein [Neolewinella antarctica]|uniref:Uncharacterized protein n=1 Tax=Neolewinella antarctica TaxID=442734 RepID=A0ABX0X6S5_9BACT|nr:hypothetical protein [Neolewinella antarctica]NJC24832.1 hypothetical protein [Neolewinella antarctica]
MLKIMGKGMNANVAFQCASAQFDIGTKERLKSNLLKIDGVRRVIIDMIDAVHYSAHIIAESKVDREDIKACCDLSTDEGDTVSYVKTYLV